MEKIFLLSILVNKKAWMDEKIFREWLYKFDAQMRAENRKILLFLDNFSATPPTVRAASDFSKSDFFSQKSIDS